MGKVSIVSPVYHGEKMVSEPVNWKMKLLLR